MHISAEGFSMHHPALWGSVFVESPGLLLCTMHSLFKYLMENESAPTGGTEENPDQN